MVKPSRDEVYARAPTLQSLGIDRMSVEERIALAVAIWEIIAAELHPPLLTEAQRRGLECRLAEHAANPDDVVPWEQIKAEALARFQQGVENFLRP